MASDDDILALLGLLVVAKCRKRLKNKPQAKKRLIRREWWRLQRLIQKKREASCTKLTSRLNVAPHDWRSSLGMDEQTYIHLLSLVQPLIRKRDTCTVLAISPHERLAVTLKFLATGSNYEDLRSSTAISAQSLGRIIPETCRAIYRVLHEDYLKFPNTEEEWINIANDFESKWNFPHCLGVLDAKHVAIGCLSPVQSELRNYKGTHSMVLLAVMDADHQFVTCDFGTNGSVSNGDDVLRNTEFFRKLANVPRATPIGNSSTDLPYVFVVGDAFPLREDTTKPFRQSLLVCRNRKIFNYRVARTRRIAENGFGILASRFGVFRTALNLKPKNVKSVVMACCVLHNFLMRSAPNSYLPPNCFDVENTEEGTVSSGYDTEDTQLLGLLRKNPEHPTGSAEKVREDFMNYFANEGRIPWQLNFI